MTVHLQLENYKWVLFQIFLYLYLHLNRYKSEKLTSIFQYDTCSRVVSPWGAFDILFEISYYDSKSNCEKNSQS